MSDPEAEPWRLNYFNYFTEIEEHFQKARGTGLFLMSPLDWALIETWKNAGVPLEAVVRGVDAAFEAWRGRKRRFRQINSLAYCTQAVMEEAERMAGLTPGPAAGAAAPPFSLEELRSYLESGESQLREAEEPYRDVAGSLAQLIGAVEEHYADLQGLEQRLSVLEDRMIALARSRQSEQEAFDARRELDRQLAPYRGKMTAEQLAMLERQYLDRRLLESAGLPRLSLFYLR